eukprot:TRINITY_DN2507_c0_g1_i1.p1 TRINITY_DN2507_c0_g1~~TRINITY_DN2507_c0_g1_i1.p1  ORF type:complete len:963 (-),score=175.04 TRINITY_DN2507_c0_g1_i1:133-3021(-)
MPVIAHLSDFLASGFSVCTATLLIQIPAFAGIQLQPVNVKDPTSFDDVIHVIEAVADGSFVVNRAVALLLLEFDSGRRPSSLCGIQYQDIKISPATEGSCGPTLSITYFKIKGDRPSSVKRVRKFAGGQPLRQQVMLLTCHADVVKPKFDVVVRLILLMTSSGSIPQTLHQLFYTETEQTFFGNEDYLFCISHSVQNHTVPQLTTAIGDAGSHTYINDLFKRAGVNTARYTAISNRKGHQTASLCKIAEKSDGMHTGVLEMTAIPKAVDTLVKVPTTFSELPQPEKERLIDDTRYKQLKSEYEEKVQNAKDVLPPEQQSQWRVFCRAAGYDALVDDAVNARKKFRNYERGLRKHLVEEEAERIREECEQNGTYQDPLSFYKEINGTKVPTSFAELPQEQKEQLLNDSVYMQLKLEKKEKLHAVKNVLPHKQRRKWQRWGPAAGFNALANDALDACQEFRDYERELKKLLVEEEATRIRKEATRSPPSVLAKSAARGTLDPATGDARLLNTVPHGGVAKPDESGVLPPLALLPHPAVGGLPNLTADNVSTTREAAAVRCLPSTDESGVPNPASGARNASMDEPSATTHATKSEPSVQQMLEEAEATEAKASTAIRKFIDAARCEHDHVHYEAPFEFTCFYGSQNRCPFKSARPCLMMEHLFTKHWACDSKKANPCCCPVCGNPFANTNELNKHIVRAGTSHSSSPKLVFNWIGCRASKPGGALEAPQQRAFEGIVDGQVFMMCTVPGGCFKVRPKAGQIGAPIGTSLLADDNYKSWKKTVPVASWDKTEVAHARGLMVKHQYKFHKKKSDALQYQFVRLEKGTFVVVQQQAKATEGKAAPKQSPATKAKPTKAESSSSSSSSSPSSSSSSSEESGSSRSSSGSSDSQDGAPLQRKRKESTPSRSPAAKKRKPNAKPELAVADSSEKLPVVGVKRKSPQKPVKRKKKGGPAAADAHLTKKRCSR